MMGSSIGYKFVPNDDISRDGLSSSEASQSDGGDSMQSSALELVPDTNHNNMTQEVRQDSLDSSHQMEDSDTHLNIGGFTSDRIWAVFLFSITTILLFADQNLLAPNLTAVANEFGFNNDERDRKLGGDIALAFFLLGAPASFLVGCLADQSNRSVLFAWTVGIGEGACLVTWFSRTYWQLYMCRAITGFSVGGALPLIYSILGDLFAAEDRHVVSAIVGMGTGVGIAFGQGVAGFLGPTFGWRTPFLVVSLPALGCAAAVLFTVQDPERGAMEKAVMERKRHETVAASYVELNVSAAGDTNQSNKSPSSITRRSVQQSSSDEEESSVVDYPAEHMEETDEYIEAFHCGQDWRSHCASTLMLLSTPTVVLTLLQGAPGCVPWGIVNTYLNDFLSENRGMSVEGATVVVLCFGIGNFFGMVLGGAGGRYMYRTSPRYPPLFAGIMAIMGCIPFWFLLNDIDSNSHYLSIGTVTILAGIGSGATGPIVKATLQNVTLPTTRGQSFAMYTLFDDFGRGLGPVFVSILIVNLGGRTPAFNIGALGWVLCGILNVCMFFTVAKDEAKVQATLAASLTSGTQSGAGHQEDLAGCNPMVGFV